MKDLQEPKQPDLTDSLPLAEAVYKPILFSTPMVQAIIRGEKSQTRRIVKNKIALDWLETGFTQNFVALPENGLSKYKIGDILWVRETWQHTKVLNLHPTDENYGFVYKADAQPWEDYEGWNWKPSIFMPKDACRIFLEVTEVRVERLNEITEADALAEGVERWTEERMKSKPTHYKLYFHEKGSECSYTSCPNDSYETLWQKINGENSWSENPFVWVYTFKQVERPYGFC